MTYGPSILKCRSPAGHLTACKVTKIVELRTELSEPAAGKVLRKILQEKELKKDEQEKGG